MMYSNFMFRERCDPQNEGTGNKMMFNADVEAFLTLPLAIKLVSLLMLIARDIGHPCQTTWVHLADKQTVNISKHWKTFTRMKTTCSILRQEVLNPVCAWWLERNSIFLALSEK